MAKRAKDTAAALEKKQVQAMCLGHDRVHRSYWLFAGDRSSVYVEMPARRTDEAAAARTLAEARIQQKVRSLWLLLLLSPGKGGGATNRFEPSCSSTVPG